MNNILLYLLKVSALTVLFYLCYLILFSKDTFYRRNRILLILILILPTIIPIIKVPLITDNQTSFETLNLIDNLISSETTSETYISDPINTFDFNKILVWIYSTVVSLLLLRLAISMITTIRIAKKGTLIESNFPKVIISNLHHPPFSFFPYIVIPTEDYRKGNYVELLAHESAHVKQGHSFDLLLCEIITAFQWFNPFMWLIKRSIILNHEYSADHASLINANIKEYQFKLLNFQTGLKNISLAHNFNSVIKNRIIMINKKPSRKYAILKNILILPVIAFAAYAFVTPEYHTATSDFNKREISAVISELNGTVRGTVLNEENNPMWGVKINISSTSLGVFTDQKGAFAIGNAPDGSSLIFSYAGYKALSLNPDFSKSMIVKMIKDPDAVAPELKIVPPPITPTGSTPSPKPLWIIDGVEKENGQTFIDPNTFNTAYFIKGDSAKSIFGEKGKNGAFVITLTKDGTVKQNVPRIVK